MTGSEISAKKFDKAAMFGYKVEEVEQYLAQIGQTVDNLNKEKAVLLKKLEILASKIEEYRRDEESMKEALLGAQRLGNTVIAEAEAKAQKVLSEAEAKAALLLRDAEEKASVTLRDAEANALKAVSGTKIQIEKEQQTLVKMQKEVANFKAKLLALYKSHLDLITALPGQDEAFQEEPAEEKVVIEEPAVEPEAEPVPEPIAEEPAVEPEAEPATETEEELDPIERAKRELENTQQIAKRQMNVVNGDLEKTQQITFTNSPQRIAFKSERVDMEKSFESKFGDLKFGKNNK